MNLRFFSARNIGIFLISITSSVQNVMAQHKVGGFVTIDELNRPGVGGVSISIRDTYVTTISDNDGEYRIVVPGNDAVLIFPYPGMLTQEIVVGGRRRIDVDLIKIPKEKVDLVFAASVNIVIDENDGKVIENVAGVLNDRLQANSDVKVSVSHEKDNAADLNIFLGLYGKNTILKRLCAEHHVEPPGIGKPFAEGYAAKLAKHENSSIIIAAGADNRGVLYAAGEILRQMKPVETGVRFEPFDVSTSPAYRFRGANATQGGTMRKYTKARPWTKAEREQAILDYALAGANCFYAEWGGGERYDFLKSIDLLTIAGIRPNRFYGDMPEEWKSGGLASWEWINSQWVCPSIPEAREVLLKQWRERLAAMADHDILRFYGGDPSGCRDERCMPWGGTFVKLCEDISNIALENHQNLIVLIANQDMTNEGDLTIFDYLSKKPVDWLYGIAYGPGSNAMSWYFRHELRDDLFEYEGFGRLNRYLAETLNELPADQKIVHYSDITHWIMAQYNVENPERNIAKSYGRRTWHTRPDALWRISQAIMPFSHGDIIYTEGYHDHFNQYLWQRLLWNPHQTAEEVTDEYCRLYFGEKAAPLMSKAIFQLEKNFIEPLATNEDIDRYYSLVREAGDLIPSNLMKNNHLWLLFMQKGSLDKYNRLKLQRELFKEERIGKVLEEALQDGDLQAAIEKSLNIIGEPAETPAMARYREEADELGMRSEQLFGVRNIGYVKITQPLRDIPGLRKMLEQAKSAKKKADKKELAAAIAITKKKTDYGHVHW